MAVGACGPSTPRGRSGAEAREGRLTCGPAGRGVGRGVRRGVRRQVGPERARRGSRPSGGVAKRAGRKSLDFAGKEAAWAGPVWADGRSGLPAGKGESGLGWAAGRKVKRAARLGFSGFNNFSNGFEFNLV